MRVYNPKDWLFFLLKSHHSKQFLYMNKLILTICLITIAIVYFEQDFLKLSDSHPLKNFVALQSLLGFAISILLVFRTNTAYDRWWEGRKLWGSLVNNSRNLAIKIKAIFPERNENSEYFRKIIPLYAKALMHHLQAESTRLMLDDKEHPELKIDKSKHIPNQIAKAIIMKTMNLHRSEQISSEQLLFLNSELSSLTEVCGACERIKNTPIPYSYSAFIKKVVFFYVITLPIGLSFTLGYYSVPIVALVFYVMVGMELVAEEIEDPFGGDENDIPMEKICSNIEKHIKEILD